uniref:Uncharacterized protein n=1 Tax=Spongospora subterranea TaxID=70186 RepID=A0A0H5RSL5_9EUKA|eukprot:CRZ11734.1 hypothetical protein [Spongospora subterranea]
MQTPKTGIVERIRLQLSQQTDWNATDKWKLDSPIEEGKVLKIIRELAYKPEEAIELQHVSPWTRRKVYLYDTETGTFTLSDETVSDENHEWSGNDGEEWMEFDKDVESSFHDKTGYELNARKTEHEAPQKSGLEVSNEAGFISKMVNNVVLNNPQKLSATEVKDRPSKDAPTESNIRSAAGNRLTAIQRKELQYRRIGNIIIGVVCVTFLALIFSGRFEPRKYTS